MAEFLHWIYWAGGNDIVIGASLGIAALVATILIIKNDRRKY